MILSTGTSYNALTRDMEQEKIEHVDSEEPSERIHKVYRTTSLGRQVMHPESEPMKSLVSVAQFDLRNEPYL